MSENNNDSSYAADDRAGAAEKVESVKNGKRRWIKAAVAVAAVIVTAAVAYSYFGADSNYTGYDLTSGISKEFSTDTGYVEDLGKLICYNGEGISIYNDNSEIEWSAALNMKNPKVVVNNGIIVAADIGGRTLLVANHKTQPITQVTLDMASDIMLADTSEQGEIAVLMQENEGNSIHLINPFDKNDSLKAEIKTYAKDDGYALSLAISQDGSKLVTEYIKSNAGKIKSTLTFYNFDKMGENSNADRIVGIFPYEDTIFPKLKFMDNDTVAAFGDKSIIVFGAKRAPELLWEYKLSDKVAKLSENKSGIAFLSSAGDDGGSFKLYAMDMDGEQSFETAVEINPKGIRYNSGEVILYSDTNCIIFNKDGSEKYRGRFSEKIFSIQPTEKSESYFVVTGKKLEVIRLKK